MTKTKLKGPLVHLECSDEWIRGTLKGGGICCNWLKSKEKQLSK